jgi:hypothetical protein
VLAAELQARCEQLRRRFVQLECAGKTSGKCRHIRRSFDSRCGAACHRVRQGIPKCTAGRGARKSAQCLLTVRGELKKRKCALVGIVDPRGLPLIPDQLRAALPIGPLGGVRRPKGETGRGETGRSGGFGTESYEVDDHDEFDGNGDAGSGGGDSGAGNDSNGGNNVGKVAARSTAGTLDEFPDRTLFIVIISLLSFVCLALLVGLLVLFFYCRRPVRKPKTKVDGLPKEFDDTLLEKNHQ